MAHESDGSSTWLQTEGALSITKSDRRLSYNHVFPSFKRLVYKNEGALSMIKSDRRLSYNHVFQSFSDSSGRQVYENEAPSV